MTLADCEWPAAAAGLKPLRLPRARRNLFYQESATHQKIAVMVDQSFSPITAKSAHGVAWGRTATERFSAQSPRAHWSGPEA